MRTTRDFESLLDEYEKRTLDAAWLLSEEAQPVLNEIRAGLHEPIRLSFVGDFSVGKSMVINSLLGEEELAPTAVQRATAMVCYFRYGPKRCVRFHYREEFGEPSKEATLGYFKHLVTHANPHDAQEREEIRRLSHIDIFFPLDVLREVTLVDTPGFGSANESDDEVTKGHLREADAVCWIFNAQKAAADDELRRLMQLKGHFRTAFALVNKCDEKPPRERARLRDRIRKECPSVFQDVLLYSAKDMLEVALRRRTLAETDCVHLTTDLTQHVVERIRAEADRIRAERAAKKLHGLAAEQHRFANEYLGYLDAAALEFGHHLPDACREAGQQFQRAAVEQRRSLGNRLLTAVEKQQSRLQRSYKHQEEGWFTQESTTLNGERLNEVHEKLTSEHADAFAAWESFLVDFANRWGTTLGERQSELSGTNAVSQANFAAIEPTVHALFHQTVGVLMARLVSQPQAYLHGATRGMLACLANLVGPNHELAQKIVGSRAQDLGEAMRQILNVEGVVSTIDALLKPSEENLMNEQLKQFQELFNLKAEELRTHRAACAELADWIRRIARNPPRS